MIHVALKHRHIGARAFVGTFGTSVFILACTILQGIIVARMLGPEGRGELAAIILWPTVISSIGLVGCHRAIARRAAKEYDIRSTINSSFWLVLILSALGIFFGLITIPHLFSGQYYHMCDICLIFLFFIPVNQLNKLFEGIDQGTGNFKRFNLLRSLINPSIMLGLMTLLVIGYVNLKGVVIVYLISSLVPCVIRLFLFRRNLLRLPNFKDTLSIFREGIFFGIQSAINEIYLRTDIFLILWTLGPRDLGLYAVGMSSTTILHCFANSTGMVAFAKSAQVMNRSRFKDIAMAFRVCILLNAVSGTFLFLMLPFIIPFVFGADFSPSIHIAEILLLGNILFGLGNILDECLLGYGYPKKSIMARITSAAVALVIGLILVRPLGLSGIAYAYVASKAIYVLWNLMSLIQGVDEAHFGMMLPKLEDITSVIRKGRVIFCRCQTIGQSIR